MNLPILLWKKVFWRLKERIEAEINSICIICLILTLLLRDFLQVKIKVIVLGRRKIPKLNVGMEFVYMSPSNRVFGGYSKHFRLILVHNTQSNYNIKDHMLHPLSYRPDWVNSAKWGEVLEDNFRDSKFIRKRSTIEMQKILQNDDKVFSEREIWP
jgi:hypothetical protein